MPPAARDQAFRILLRVETSDAFASILLRGLPAAMEPRERALAHELVLGTLRWQGYLDHGLAQFSRPALPDLDPPVRVALRLAAHQVLRLSRIPARAAVDESVRLARSAAGRAAGGFVNAVLRALCRGEPRWPGPDADPVERLAVVESHPRWLVARRVARLGVAEAAAALAADNRPAPTTLRANRRRGDRVALQARLAADGVRAEPGRWAPDALRVDGPLPPAGALAEGWCYAQDEASQLVAEIVAPRAGERIADLCAAPGGKSTVLAERVQGCGLVIASDRHPGRMRLVRDNARRLGADRLRLLIQDAARPALAAGRLDRVLVDAPCTGTGILRRHPEIRWRRQESDVPRLAATQRRLLAAAAGLVPPGGTIVYSVCSLEPEEGPEVVADLIARLGGLKIVDPRQAWDLLPGDLVDEGPPGPHLRTWPHRHDTDGFFAAVLRRTA
jgi:16S rRNA (cytosine967-C5)-methyltransferase